MPVPTPPKNGNNNNGFNWGRFSKTLSFWILIILIPVALIQMTGARAESAPEIRYDFYRQQLESGNIAEVTVQEIKVNTGATEELRPQRFVQIGGILDGIVQMHLEDLAQGFAGAKLVKAQSHPRLVVHVAEAANAALQMQGRVRVELVAVSDRHANVLTRVLTELLQIGRRNLDAEPVNQV